MNSDTRCLRLRTGSMYPHVTRRSRISTTITAALLASAYLLIPVRFAVAQESGDAEVAKVHPLASKEEMIRDRFQRFEDRVYRLRELLGDGEPDNALRLGRVLQRAGELGLADRLEEMIELLHDPSLLNDATDTQARWLADADRVLAILLERDSENVERKQALERLQEYYQRVDKILEQQRDLRHGAGQASTTGRMTEQLDQAIERINALLDRQADISEDTERGLDAIAQTPKQLAEQQGDLSRDTGQMAGDLQRLGAMLPQPAADAPTQQSPQGNLDAAADSVQNAEGAMQSASSSLQQGDAPSARQQQEEASDALRQAREELEEAKGRLEEQQDARELAPEQQKLADETGGLSEQMQRDAQAGGAKGQPGAPGAQGESSPPGQQSLDQAQQEMGEAAEALGQSNPQEAMPSQDQAIQQLEQARKELEEALNQLRQEEREETLRDLEGRFREMLLKQRAINESTARYDQLGRDNFTRAEHLQLADLSTQERTLSEDAASCLHILDEDGTTIVFPNVVGHLSEDMGAVADRLAAYQVGALTQAIEQEIVETLEQLLGAVQRMRQDNEQQGMSGLSSDAGQSPLLPQSAELKLLRASQLRVNTRTAAIEEDVKTIENRNVQTDSDLLEVFRAVAARQVECAGIAKEMRDRRYQP